MRGEIKQKIAIARHDFNQLAKIWNHVNVPVKLKFNIYQQCILSKLLFGLFLEARG